MTEAEWLSAADPTPMLEFLDRKPKARKFGLLACACCQTVFEWLIDNRSREAISVMESFIDGQASESDLQQAGRLASRVSIVVGGSPARAVTWAGPQQARLYLLLAGNPRSGSGLLVSPVAPNGLMPD